MHVLQQEAHEARNHSSSQRAEQRQHSNQQRVVKLDAKNLRDMEVNTTGDRDAVSTAHTYLQRAVALF